MMATAVCISRTLAAGGTAVGRLVAERLGYDYFDDEIITLASEKAHVDPGLLAKVEQHEGMVTRVMDALSGLTARKRTSGPQSKESTEATVAAVSKPPARNESRQLIRDVIIEIGQRGNAVIVAHAASIPLAGMKGVLRVLVTAPAAVRAERLEFDLGIVGERDALTAVHESDRARLDYLRDFYGVADETALLYDLVINTEVLSNETAAGIIVDAARGGAAS